ncbi:ATP-binding protein [Aquisalimonas asiatica]|uniref:histidine kinase n=1 Tax=Aquisalimonas asiatica TaxID=406100 RepID=A0A1H8QCL9_9GAMM|nr:ATP-binding protein [Aquisalimonas asiatica]SEO51985.1 two-component system, NarL family, sensor histidine kinase BarA [Aquisalimonas asiatica]
MRWGLGTRIFLLAVLAPMLAATVLVGYLLVSRAHHIHDELVERGESVARQLAPALREPLAHDQDTVLHQIAAAARLDPAISAVTIQRGDGRIVVRHTNGSDEASRAEGWMVGLGSALLGLQQTPSFRVPVVESPAPLLDRLPMDSGMQPMGWVVVDVDATPYLHREAIMVARAAAVLGVALLVSTLLAYIARRSVTRPVTRLTETVRRLGAGDLRARVHLLAGGEIGLLARAVNRMAIRLERTERDLNDQVEQATRELRETLEAVEIQNVELDIARKRALEGSKVKSEFLANMSHEIRTPINGILGFTDLLSHSQLDDEQRDYVATIRESSTNLLSLVNDILDFSKIEAGKLVIDNVAFDMRDCIEEVMSLMAPAAYGKSLELVHLIYQDVPCRLFGDPIRVRQILTNLVHNAIKFTPQGRVVVRVMLDEDGDDRVRIRMSVTDTGIGLKPDEQDKLFQAFSQADTSITRRFGGAGLGLIICKKLVEQMGGAIGLESSPGTGSTFWFTLECVKQRGQEHEERPLVRHNPLENRRVLLHDTSTLSRLAVRHLLESWEMEVRDEEHGDIFLSAIRNDPAWDCIILGLSREELNRRYFRDLMAQAQALEVPVVVLASSVDRNELRSLYQQGAQTCLPKAVRRQTLYRELCRVLTSAADPLDTDTEQLLPTSFQPRRTPAVAAPRSRFHGTRVLVVDDNAINRKLVSTILRRQGAEVDEAADGRRAVDRCTEMDYPLVFMDIHMPSLSGEAAYQEISDNARHRGAPAPRVVALTANAMPGERERLTRLGMDECLIKPVTEAQVIHQLRLVADRPADIDAMDTTEPEPVSVDADLNAEMRDMLIAELPEHRRAIRSAYRRGELDTLRDSVHRLNGAASVCRAETLQRACDALERSVVDNHRVDIPAGVERVVRAINDLLDDEARRQRREE